ncbi:hypothetical protein [Haloferax sp. Q22]|uniref:hypothetical protein n=1 Tax=Haloferax sp. (strain Q22) TaxID=1526048 RepID=UPI000B16F626|nr:hypothetical protein [Haloferax sp. Q22]
MATVVVVVCPHCGQQVESRYEGDADFDGVRQRLKSEYRVARQTCPVCSNPYDLRRA